MMDEVDWNAAKEQAEFNRINNTQASDFFLLKDEHS